MTRQEGSGNELLGRLIQANKRPVRIVRPRSGTTSALALFQEGDEA